MKPWIKKTLIGLFGAGILVLTGSGLYRLLIDDGQPPTAADLQISQDQQTSPLPHTHTPATCNRMPNLSPCHDCGAMDGIRKTD